MTPVRCWFYERVAADGGGWHYDRIARRGPDGADALVTATPPAVGDSVYLPGGMFRVVERSWLYSAWGSVDWPYGEPEPVVGPMLDCVVERCAGLFVDEVGRPGEGGD